MSNADCDNAPAEKDRGKEEEEEEERETRRGGLWDGSSHESLDCTIAFGEGFPKYLVL